MKKDQLENIMVIEDLWLGYGKDEYLVKAMHAAVRAGEMTALVGRNGTGKSTLLRTIAGILKPRRGSVRLHDRPLNDVDPREFARAVSFVGAGSSAAEDLTVVEMVSLGRHPYTNWWGSLREADRLKVRESLYFVGMEGFEHVKVDRLSDGERQRVMIARALAQDTNVMILDEPTAFLDIPNRIGIVEVLHKLRAEGRTVIFSTHDFDNAFTHADKIWVIHDRQLIDGAPEDLGMAGTFADLFSDSGVVFDDRNLHFLRERTLEQAIRVILLDEQVNYWTCRALERAGYRMETEGEETPPFIRIEHDEAGYRWVLQVENRSLTFLSLYRLTEHLVRIK
jgi:iron complex transport system ATP-binding protein